MPAGLPLQDFAVHELQFGVRLCEPTDERDGVSPLTSRRVEDRFNSYLNPAAFSTAPRFTFGNVTRTLIHQISAGRSVSLPDASELPS